MIKIYPIITLSLLLALPALGLSLSDIEAEVPSQGEGEQRSQPSPSACDEPDREEGHFVQEERTFFVVGGMVVMEGKDIRLISNEATLGGHLTLSMTQPFKGVVIQRNLLLQYTMSIKEVIAALKKSGIF